MLISKEQRLSPLKYRPENHIFWRLSVRQVALYFACALSMLTLGFSRSEAQTPKKQQKSSPTEKVVTQLQKPALMSAKETFQKFHNCVFTLKTDKSLGTGFLFAPMQMLTCYHVINGTHVVKAIDAAGKETTLDQVLCLNKEQDFANLVSPSLWRKMSYNRPFI